MSPETTIDATMCRWKYESIQRHDCWSPILSVHWSLNRDFTGRPPPPLGHAICGHW